MINLDEREREFINSNVISVFASKDKTPKIIGFLTKEKNSGKLSSIKSKNILINLRVAIQEIPQLILDSASAASLTNLPAKFKIPAFLLYLIIRLKNLSKIKLDEISSIVLVSLWECRTNGMEWVNIEDGYKRSIVNLKKVGISKLSKKRYKVILDDLLKIECISRLSNSAVYLEEKILFTKS